MKYMMSIKQPITELYNADELHVNYDEIGRIYDLIAKDIHCNIYIYITKTQEINWEDLQKIKIVITTPITLVFENTLLISEAKYKGYRTCWLYPATTYQEIRGLINLGVDEILIDAPLCFDLPSVKMLCSNIELRMIANQCFSQYLPQENGICGVYIRPEDIKTYEQYIDHIEFYSNDLQQELTLIKVYKQEKWNGNLNLLLTNLNYNIDNRAINTSEFAEHRLSCGQRCKKNNICHYCKTLFESINTIEKTFKE